MGLTAPVRLGRNALGTPSFLKVVGTEFARGTQLNDHWTLLCCREMRDAGRDHDKAARRVALQLSGVEHLPLTQIPSPLDDRHKLVVRVRVRRDAHARGYLGPVHPRAASTGIPVHLGPLSPILVVRRREPPHLRRHDSDNILLALLTGVKKLV